MWERAPRSCCLRETCVSPHSCHSTLWAGVASSTTENKYSLSQTTDTAYQQDKKKSLLCFPVRPWCHMCLSSVGTVATPSHDLLLILLFVHPLVFSEMAHQISVKCKHVQGRAGRWQRDWWAGPLKGLVCVCVCVCVCMCVLCLAYGWGPSPPRTSLHLPRYSPEACQPDVEHSAGNPKFHHLTMVIHTHTTQTPLSLDWTELCVNRRPDAESFCFEKVLGSYLWPFSKFKKNMYNFLKAIVTQWFFHSGWRNTILEL